MKLLDEIISGLYIIIYLSFSPDFELLDSLYNDLRIIYNLSQNMLNRTRMRNAHSTNYTSRYEVYLEWDEKFECIAYIVRKNWILVTCSGTIGRLSIVRDYWNEWTATNHLLRIIPNENEIHPGYLTAFLLSIYGQVQFQRLIYGGVVDEIGEAGELFNDLLIGKPKNKDIENKIGNFTFEAYDKRDKANQIEDEAIKSLERRLKEIAGGKP